MALHSVTLQQVIGLKGNSKALFFTISHDSVCWQVTIVYGMLKPKILENSMLKSRIIDGKALAMTTMDKITFMAQQYTSKAKTPPCLAVILVGENPASMIYIRNKSRAAEKAGFISIQKTLPENIAETELISIIQELNSDPAVNGILVQLPLPAHINDSKIIELIRPEKDVDGFHPINVGYLILGEWDKTLIPCTPSGCLALAKSVCGNNLSGLNTVIVGRSNIVGKPSAHLFLAEHCTVTIAHSRTHNLHEITRNADILVAAVGHPEIIKGTAIKPDAIVIDVGINRIPAPEKGAGKSRIIGDVDFASAMGIAGAITPVPGGVGPMTIAMLMKNTLIAASRQNGIVLPT